MQYGVEYACTNNNHLLEIPMGFQEYPPTPRKSEKQEVGPNPRKFYTFYESDMFVRYIKGYLEKNTEKIMDQYPRNYNECKNTKRLAKKEPFRKGKSGIRANPLACVFVGCMRTNNLLGPSPNSKS